METKTHWRKVFNSKYLKSCDLEDGQKIIATIEKVVIEKVKNDKEKDCNVAYFTDNKIKPMVLNSGNCKTVKMFANSPFVEDWKNIPVEIYSIELNAFGEDTEGLRISKKKPINPNITIDIAIKDMLSKKTKDDIHECWKKYINFQKNEQFINACKQAQQNVK